MKHNDRVMSGMGVRMHHWHRRLTYLGLLIVAVTGIAWTVSHDALEAGPNAFERWMLMVHGGASFAAMMIFGSVLPQHVRIAWRLRRNRLIGALVLTALAVLVLTAYALYYGNEELRPFVKWSHVGIGVLAALLMPLHIWRGRRRPALAEEAPEKLDATATAARGNTAVQATSKVTKNKLKLVGRNKG